MQVNQQVIQSYLNQRNYHHTTMVRHHGHVIVFVMDADRRIAYTVLDSREDSNAHDWLAVQTRLEQMVPVDFPAAFVHVRHGAGEATRLPAAQDPFLSTTARFTAEAPFQALSDGDDVYLFRQSRTSDHTDMVSVEVEGRTIPLIDNTLLLDRYVVANATLQLKRTATDHAPEPTSVLDFVRHLQAGRFTVMLLPTLEAATKRWQIFAYNRTTPQIDAFNVKRAVDGLFDTTVRPGFDSPNEASSTAESALRFTTGDSYVDCGVGIDLRQTDFTIELWAKRAGPDANQLAIGHGRGRVASRALHIGFRNTNQFTFAFFNDDLNTQRRFRDTDWHHWACVYTHAERRRTLYCDGAQVGSNIAKASYQGTGAFVIGRAPWGEGWGGHIDEVRVWRRARRAVEIQNDRLHRLVGDEPGLVAYWRFDEGRGNTTHDHTGNAHHGTLHGNTDNAMWVTSSAPVRPHPSLERSSFAIAGRTITSGLSALLYTPQGRPEITSTPDLARVLLAVTTGDATARGPQAPQPSIALVDFAVSPYGKLVQVQDTLTLPAVAVDATTLNALQQLWQGQAVLQARIAQGFVGQDPPLAASAPQMHAYFGAAVALSGDWAIIGAHEASPDGIAQAGSAEVFHREANGAWVRKATLTAHTKQVNVHFGVAVALSGHWALVGTYEASPGGIDYAGSVEVFHLEADDTWAYRQTLTASDPTAHAHFGVAVALEGPRAIVGADAADADSVVGAGKAYIFQLQADNTWAEQARLTARLPQENAGFGSAVALSGGWALVGAYGARPDRLVEAGSAYLFRQDGVRWVEHRTLTARDKQAHACFGGAVALHGGWALVGADRAAVEGAAQAGRVSVFQLEGEVWAEQPPLVPSPVTAKAHFGRAVALSDRWAIVGAERPGSQASDRAGRAYVFQRFNGTWVAKPPLDPAVPQASASFSSTVSLSDDRALISAAREDVHGTAQAGRTYVYDASLTTQVTDLDHVQADIQRLYGDIGKTALPLPLVHRDPSGLMVYGGVLDVASLEETPFLVDGATGTQLWPALLVQRIARQP
jgi:hypothetical protein